MPQGPIAAAVAVQPNVDDVNYYAPLNLDANGNLLITGTGAGGAQLVTGASGGLVVVGGASGALVTGVAKSRTLNITTPTVVKNTAGRVGYVNIVVAGSAAGAVYDFAATSGVSAATQIAVLPDTVTGPQVIDFPVTTGIVVVPGTGMTVAVSWI